MIKTVFWFTGTSCVGKSTLAVQFSIINSLKFIHLDNVEFYLKQGLSLDDSFEKLITEVKESVFVIDGRIDIDINYINAIYKCFERNNIRVIYLLVCPEYLDFVRNQAKRYLKDNNFNLFLNKTEYTNTNNNILNKIGKCIEIRNNSDLLKISRLDVDNLFYQKEGFTDIKWKQLQINCKGKSILDLGCCACFYEYFSIKEGAIKYTGLDINKAEYFSKNAYYFDLNNLDVWEQKADIVVCSSVIHYFNDRDKFIKECARLTKELFVVEMPLTVQGFPNSDVQKFPTKEEIELLLNRYFVSVENKGRSIVQDNTYRLIYHCKK